MLCRISDVSICRIDEFRRTGYPSLDLAPLTFGGLTTRHGGLRRFLADDSVCACIQGQRPPATRWRAAFRGARHRVAHEPALRCEASLEVPVMDDPPAC